MVLLLCGACSCEDSRLPFDGGLDALDAQADVTDADDTSVDTGAVDTGAVDTALADTTPDVLPDVPLDTTPPPPDECEEIVGVPCDEVSLGNAEAPVASAFGNAFDVGDGLIAVGALRENRPVDAEDSDADVRQAGAAYVFVPAQSGWRDLAHLTAEHADDMDQAGAAIAMSDDGSVVAVGVRSNDADADDPRDNSENGAGAIVVYRRRGEAYVEDAFLTLSTATGAESVGGARTLSMSADGRALIVGASNHRFGGTGVFDYAGGTWIERGVLQQRSVSRTRFGVSTAVSADGTVFAVGDSQSGAVHLYERGAGEVGREVERFEEREGFNAGRSIDVSADGNTIAIGSWSHNSESVSEELVDVHIRSGRGMPFRTVTIRSPFPVGDRRFFGAAAPAISSDGRFIAIPASHTSIAGAGIFGAFAVGTDDDALSGAVFIYRLTSEEPELALILKSRVPESNAFFGTHVRLAPDDGSIFVSSRLRVEGFRIAL